MKPDELLRALQPDGQLDSDTLFCTPLGEIFTKMAKTPQSPIWHAEGDVYKHTKMVCTVLCGLDSYKKLPAQQRKELLLAAVLHDMGKIVRTRYEDGFLVSPGHSKAGAHMARELLWREFGFCGTPELIAFRETVCLLIQYHSFPPRAIEHKDARQRVISVASCGELVPDFNMEMLCILAEADIAGRKSPDCDEQLEAVYLCAELARENKCLYSPVLFTDAFSRFAYLSGRNIQPDQELYDDTWGEVILMSGLPGTGKDTWISKNYTLPTVSLDEIRKKLKISPVENQGVVVNEAIEQAKVFLRQKQSFVWNATNITSLRRGGLVRLFTDYHARTKTVYLETEWNELLKRNESRPSPVPQVEIERMLGKLEMPDVTESCTVEWKCV